MIGLLSYFLVDNCFQIYYTTLRDWNNLSKICKTNLIWLHLSNRPVYAYYEFVVLLLLLLYVMNLLVRGYHVHVCALHA